MESNYDYFGARYYDSRIGRWGQTEPLLDKYVSWSSYLYALDNPTLLKDVNGFDVYVTGNNAIATVKALNESSSANIFFAIDPNTGKLQVEGKPANDAESKIIEAINDENVVVDLNVTTENTYKSQDGSSQLFMTGAYDGSSIINGKVHGFQFFNLEHAEKLASIGGPNVAESIIHEVNESYIGAKKYPGTKFSTFTYKYAHRQAEKLDVKNKSWKSYIKQKGQFVSYGYENTETSEIIYLYKFNTISNETTNYK